MGANDKVAATFHPETEALQCRFFGGAGRPVLNAGCTRPAQVRKHGLVLCEVHYVAIHVDAEDWTDEERDPQVTVVCSGCGIPLTFENCSSRCTDGCCKSCAAIGHPLDPIRCVILTRATTNGVQP